MKTFTWLNRLGPILALLVVYGLFACLAPPSFRSVDNLELMARQTAVVGVAAIGMTFVIMTAGIDLSIGSVVALTTMIIAVLLNKSVGPFWAGCAGVGAAMLCGLVNGLIITRLKVVPFIATLGTLLVVRGLAKLLGNEQKVDAPRTWLRELLATVPADRSWMLVPPGVWALMVLMLLAALLLYFTKFGRHVIAVGSNEQTARLCGVPVQRVKLYVYAMCGAGAGVAGLLRFSRLNIGDPVTSIGMELDVIAAAVIGGGSLSGGEGSILGSIVGALIMTIIKSGCTHLGLPNFTQEIITGCIIVTAVALDRLRHRQ